jgi:chaperone required for assembly of F1-ATPase
VKRFYQQAIAKSCGRDFSILLDGKPLKTPLQDDFVVPNAELAEAIAAEWAAQPEKINPASMLLTKFVNSTIDGIAKKMDDVRRDILSYAQTDLLFYRALEPQALQARQARAWDPILDWLKARNIDFNATKGVMPLKQPEKSLAALHEALMPFEPFTLAAIASITALTGSACLAYAVAEDYLSAEAAWDAAHIDEDFQIEQWGRDDEATARRAGRLKEMEAAARLLALVKEPA